MKYELLHLKQFFPNLGTQSGDPLVKVYLPDNLTEMGRDDEQHPCLIVCPGGAYEFCSQHDSYSNSEQQAGASDSPGLSGDHGRSEMDAPDQYDCVNRKSALFTRGPLSIFL